MRRESCEVCGIHEADDILTLETPARVVRLFVCAGCGFDLRNNRPVGMSKDSLIGKQTSRG